MSEGPKKRRWFRFSMRTLFVVMTVAGCALALWVRAERKHSLVERHLQAAREALASSYAAHERLMVVPGEQRPRWLPLFDYHMTMADRHQRSIWQPWVELELEPDKPPVNLPP